MIEHILAADRALASSFIRGIGTPASRASSISLSDQIYIAPDSMRPPNRKLRKDKVRTVDAFDWARCTAKGEAW